jgi:hypothetical protein
VNAWCWFDKGLPAPSYSRSYAINKAQKLFKKTVHLGLRLTKSLSIIRLLADAATQQQAGAAKNSHYQRQTRRSADLKFFNNQQPISVGT